MDIRVFVTEENIGTLGIDFTDVSEVRFEKRNENNAKPDVLVVMRNTDSKDWGAMEVAGEFDTAKVVGWAKTPYLSKDDPGTDPNAQGDQ